MVLFNHATREMTAKIVYYGPGLCGKTTNLLVIFDKLDPKSRGKMLSLATKSDRTLFFDLLPVDVGRIGPFNLKIQLYTVPGQVFYNETRRLVLKSADAVVFVVDSQASMVQSNKESFDNLIENLEENQIDPNDIPIVIQYNKRDIPGVPSVEALAGRLGLEGFPALEAAALNGRGVMETFKLATKLTTRHLIAKYQGRPSRPMQPVIVSPKSRPPESGLSPEPELPPDRGYDAMEEVTVEQMLKGRDRPTTLGGLTPVPPPPISVDEELSLGEPEEERHDEVQGEPDVVFAGSESEEEIEDLEAEGLSPLEPGESESPFASVAEFESDGVVTIDEVNAPIEILEPPDEPLAVFDASTLGLEASLPDEDESPLSLIPEEPEPPAREAPSPIDEPFAAMGEPEPAEELSLEPEPISTQVVEFARTEEPLPEPSMHEEPELPVAVFSAEPMHAEEPEAASGLWEEPETEPLIEPPPVATLPAFALPDFEATIDELRKEVQALRAEVAELRARQRAMRGSVSASLSQLADALRPADEGDAEP